MNAIDMAVLNNHETVASFLFRKRQESYSPQLLNNAVHASSSKLLALICEHSTRGCFFEAMAIAIRKQRMNLVKMPTELISDDVDSCSLAQHLSRGATTMSEACNSGPVSKHSETSMS